MSHEAVWNLARHLGLRCSMRDSKLSVIRAIQARVGHPPCCGTDDRLGCRAGACRWRHDCQKPIAIWRR
ncbi:MAG TPA: hypothetical protein VKA14_02210 [Gammaproteobacteria bacterium]|nr:hypothetical protein [Gammaproteobacteria bacterium]